MSFATKGSEHFATWRIGIFVISFVISWEEIFIYLAPSGFYIYFQFSLGLFGG
jgi:hypothetical protein